MPFITNYNAERIVQKLVWESNENLEDHLKNESVYKINIYFFSKKEEEKLKLLKLFCKKPELIKNLYVKIKNSTPDNYVIENSPPAYHSENDCERLNSNYINIEIPEEIKEKGEEAIQDYKQWVKDHFYLLEEGEKERFLELARGVFFDIPQIEKNIVTKLNSGTQLNKNYDLKELEEKIEATLREIEYYYQDKPNLQYLIKNYQTKTFLIGYDEIYQDTHFTDKQFREHLKKFYNKFKKPVKNYLFEYYKIMLNPELEFKETLLEQIGFKKCSSCFDEEYETVISFTLDD